MFLDMTGIQLSFSSGLLILMALLRSQTHHMGLNTTKPVYRVFRQSETKITLISYRD